MLLVQTKAIKAVSQTFKLVKLARVAQAEGRHMLAKGYGRIINTASMASLLVPHPQKQVRRRVLSALFVPCTLRILRKSRPHDCKARRDVACYATQWLGHTVAGFHSWSPVNSKP